MIACGDAFLISDSDENFHLHVVLTQPTVSGEVITVSITTQRRRLEALVVLNAGDHPFLRHPSVAAFGFSRIRSVTQIETAIANGTAVKRESVSPHVLTKLQRGLLESSFTPNGVLAFFKEVMDQG